MSLAKLLLDLLSMQPLLSTVRKLAEHPCLNAVLTSLEAVFNTQDAHTHTGARLQGSHLTSSGERTATTE